MKKLCVRCNKKKDVRQFFKRKEARDGRRKYCKLCDREIHALWVERNKSGAASIDRRSNLKRRYGITPEDFNRMLLSQEGKCAICKTDNPKGGRSVYGAGPGNGWRIDHDHATNVLRGILCHRCNAGLGLFEDNKSVLSQAILYLGGV